MRRVSCRVSLSSCPPFVSPPPLFLFCFCFADRYLLFFFNRGLAAAKHAAFVRARGRHYSNEAEAMKVRDIYTYIYTLACTNISLNTGTCAN